MSLATRISLLAACAVGLAVSIASLAAYVSIRDQLHNQLDQSLLRRAEEAAHGQLAEIGVLTDPSLFDVWGAADLRIFLVYEDGSVRPRRAAELVSPVSEAEQAVATTGVGYSLRTITQDGVKLRAATVPASEGKALMFVQSMQPIENTLDRMGLVLLLVGAGGIVAAAIIGLAVARSALMPVRRLSAAADTIARTEQLQPIAVTGDDELASLASSFNKMLASLAASRERQRRLVADAGHELRTPLTSLRTNLELLAQADRRGGLTSGQRNEIFSDVIAQVEELSTLVGDLVELARDEPVQSAPEPVDLAALVDRAIERVKRRTLGADFDVTTAPWWVMGESGILERAVTNLLDNAVKWSPSGGGVRVELDHGTLTVSDSGPGIDEADLPMIFDRFYRAERARAMPGSGLGLAIVRQAAERHGGSVSAANREPHGATFTLRLPGAVTADTIPVAPHHVIVTSHSNL
jgi:two-component system sensor histidine kinase MprB